MSTNESRSLQNTASSGEKAAGVVDFYDKAFVDITGQQHKNGKWSTDFPVDEVDDYSLRTLAYRGTAPADNWVPRPALLIRVLWVVLILTLGVLTIFAGLMAHLVSGITAKVYEDIQEPTLIVAEPLPENAVLRDDEQFALLLEQRPQRRLQLELARLAALKAHGDFVAARDLVRQLSAEHKMRHYNSSDYMDIAEYNAELGFPDQAWAMVEGKDLSQWPPRDQQRAVALVGRLLPYRQKASHN